MMLKLHVHPDRAAATASDGGTVTESSPQSEPSPHGNETEAPLLDKAMQVFWHLDVFRRSYRRLLGHTCMGNSCIFCALKVIFTQFQYSDKSSLHPDALRKALAETFANQQRFQLGHMDDAAECFENILRRIHYHVACNQNEDACAAPHCLPHQKFSMVVYERVVCPCGGSSSPLKFSEMVHYVSASALVAQSRIMHENGDALHPDRFGLLLRKAGAMGDARDCPSDCGNQLQKQRTLLNIPDVVSVGLVWDSDHPSMETTTEVAAALGTAILLQDMYHRVMPDVRKLPRLQLVAVVCYYGKHYSTFVFHSKLKTWIYFDDATVQEIGPQWKNVVERCSRGRFQPLLLLYANPSAAPVSVDTAPRKRVMAPGYAPVGTGEDSEGGLDRTHENLKVMGSTAARATTPTPKVNQPNVGPGSFPSSQAPDTPSHDSGRDSPARLSREHSRQPSFLFAVTGKNDRNKAEGGEGGEHGSGPFHPNCRRQLLDGGASMGHLESMAEEAGSYTDYTLSSGDQYRRPSLNGVDSKNQIPMPPNVSRYPDTQRKDSFTKRTPSKEKGGVDVVRYHVDPSRVGAHAPDLSYPSHADGSKGGKVGHKPPAPHGRQRSLSSGRDEDGGETTGSSQHVVVKPKLTGHGHYEPADPMAHTAVQSGLATLPRQKGPPNTHGADSAPHQRSGSTHQEVAQLTRKGRYQCTAVDPPLPPGTPPPEYNASDDGQPPHSRQTSLTSQPGAMKNSASVGHIDQVATTKKTDGEKVKKKVKKEKKSEKDASKKSEKKKGGKSDAALKKSESEGDLVGGAEKRGQYIDRRMVENILKHQGVHRQNSSCSNNSASSVESDSLMGKLLASKASGGGSLTADSIPFDNMSLGSQKDSGYGSSDRNSSSSTGSGTVDPYTQYFLSKSMVVPRSVNTQHLMEQQYSNKNGSDPYGGGHPSQGVGVGGSQREDGRLIMHPIKESSQEDMLRFAPNEPLGTQKFIVANTTAPPPSEARGPAVPPKNFAQFQIIKSSGSQSAHERESSLDSLDKDETISEDFVVLCKKADVLMDNCMIAETNDNFPSALYFCEAALVCLKEAMAQKELNSKALAYVQKKHNSCLLKSRTLQKRGPSPRQEPHPPPGMGTDVTSAGGNRSSITSSDSDMSDQLSRQPRPDSRGSAHPRRSLPSQDSSGSYNMHHERQRSTSRQDNVHERQRSASRQDNIHERQHSASRQDNIHERQHSASRQDNIHERQHSASRQDNIHERQRSASRQGADNGRGMDSRNGGRRDSSVPRTQRASSGSQDLGTTHPRTDSSGGGSRLPQSHSSNYLQGPGGAEGGGTLPRNKPRRLTSDGTEVYQSFLHTQKNLQAEASSGHQSQDDTGSEHGSTGSGHRMGRPDMRPTLQDSQGQRQWQHCGSGQQYTSQQGGSIPYPHPQDVRQCSSQVPQRPVNYSGGQSGQHVVSGRPSWQQQQQQQHQGYHPPPAAHTPHPVSSYPPHHHLQQQQPCSDGLKSLPPSALQGPRGSLPPSHPVQTAPPSFPKPSSLSHSLPPPSAGKPRSQGQTRPPCHDVSEVGRQGPSSSAGCFTTPTPQLPGCGEVGSGGSYLAMMPSSSSKQALPPGVRRQSNSAVPTAGATPALNPLPRCASHPDCQKLVDTAFPANLSDQSCSSGCRLSSVPLECASSSDQLHVAHSSTDPQTPVSVEDVGSEMEGTAVSVRALASRFENTGLGRRGSAGSRPCSRHGSVKSDSREQSCGGVSVHRTRSKSESFSRKPKSVLKNKKNKNRPRKSVTFSDSLALYANCDEVNSGYESARELSSPRVTMDDRAYYSDDEERRSFHVSHSDNELDDVEDTGSSNSDDSPLGDDDACQLCHKRRNEPGKLFCAKCSFYMGKLNSS
ncbi:uncharacterized protein LOC143286794 isoform X2 [Babylonia areolata]|uniref:uncharacterized protein LOC143286794 isoform X2 n=1 Tax=Babylonia areolata TaxID=304850 RepID=UPI003FD29D4C